MKRISIAVAMLLASVLLMDAQVKSADDAKKAVESALAATDNPKKAAKPATWIKLANAYVDAYDSPRGAGWTNARKQELSLIMGNVKPKSVETVNLAGETFSKEIYSTMNYYFDGAGVLRVIEVTKPVYPDALEKAQEALAEAAIADVKGKKTKDINAAYTNIATKFQDAAVSAYMLGNMDEASRAFEKAYLATEADMIEGIDTTSLYNAGFTAWMQKDYKRSEPFLKKCVEYGYHDNGEIYARLSDVYMNLADSTAAKTTLETGFGLYPQCNNIVIGLINYYIASNEDPNRLFELLDEAKRLDPTNASLYYVEGDIHKKLGNTESAVASYMKATEINPNYEFGYIGMGVLYYDKAIELQDMAAKEMDDAKYMALVEELEKTLENAIEPFEKAFNVSQDNTIKVTLAEYLKNIYFRFRDKNDAYKESYEKYNSIVANGL